MKALLVLSPLEPRFLHPHAAAQMALSLKSAGTSQADLTSNTHFAAAGSHGTYAVASFAAVAGNVSQMMQAVIGKSNTYNIGDAMDRSILPDVRSLLTVANLCLRQTGSTSYTGRDVRDVALVLYAAIHINQYDRMVFPHMTHAAQQALLVIAKNLRGLETDLYGKSIFLDCLRGKIVDLCVRPPAPGTRLN